MAEEEIIPPNTLYGRELGLRETLGLTLGGTLGGKKPNVLKCRPQPINLEVARDPNIFINSGWHK